MACLKTGTKECKLLDIPTSMCYSGTTVPLRDLLCNQDYSHNLCEVVDLELDEVRGGSRILGMEGLRMKMARSALKFWPHPFFGAILWLKHVKIL